MNRLDPNNLCDTRAASPGHARKPCSHAALSACAGSADGPAQAPERARKAAFTLIEMLVVLVIIAILAGISVSVSKYVSYRSSLAKQAALYAQIHAALDAYRAAYGEYPITLMSNNPTAENREDVRRHYGTEDAAMFSTNTVTINRSLSYPLMIGPLDKGEKAFMIFPDTVYANVYDASGVYGSTEKRRKFGKIFDLTRFSAGGGAKKYPMAVDPLTQRQIAYYCTNGTQYTLDPSH